MKKSYLETQASLQSPTMTQKKNFSFFIMQPTSSRDNNNDYTNNSHHHKRPFHQAPNLKHVSQNSPLTYFKAKHKSQT